MRIGIDGRALQFRSWGGVRHYSLELLQALFRLDHGNEYHVFYNAWKKIEVPRFSEFPNVAVHYSRWPNKLFNLSIRLFNRPAFHIASGALDILLVPNLNFVVCPASTKLVVVAHDLSFEHFPEHFTWRLRIWHRALNPRTLFKRADQIIAVSEHTKSDLVETYGIMPEKIKVTYPGLNNCHPERLSAQIGSEGSLTDVSLHAQEIPRFARNDKLGNYILYLGALEPRKNIEGLIAAYEALYTGRLSLRRIGGSTSIYHLVIAGLSTPYVKRLKKRIAQSKLRDQIILKENPTEEEKAKLYASARLFVYPSFYEGFGFPPLEAMSYGVPVVASSASSVPEICGDAAVLVSPWKVEEIKQGMRILLEDEEVRKRYIAAGYERIKQFSWESCGAQVLEILKRVV